MQNSIKTIDFFKEVFKPYPHQLEFFRALFSGKFQFFMQQWHRRAGKDAAFFNACWVYALIFPGNYVYTLPKIAQARNVLWEAKTLDGVAWIDTIPKMFVRKRNESTSKIYLINGSIIQFTGADNLLNSNLGANLRGVFVSEFQRTHPAIWDYLRPILRRSNGIGCINFTALGKGHHHILFEKTKSLPGWYNVKLTVDDTKDWEGNRIITPEMIQEERDSGMEEDLILQEYYCSPDAAIRGAFFSEEIKLAYEEKRIRPMIEIEPNVPVHTSWDIGSKDTNSIWFFQYINNQFRYFHQFDENYKSIPWYKDKLEALRKQFGFKQYGHHFVPHDIDLTEYGTGQTRFWQAQQAGINMTVVPRLKVIERVQCARNMFKRVVIDSSRCAHGLEALNTARSYWDEKMRTFTKDEVHDWSSHPSAAFQYGLVGWLDSYNQPAMLRQKQYARLRS